MVGGRLEGSIDDEVVGGAKDAHVVLRTEEEGAA